MLLFYFLFRSVNRFNRISPSDERFIWKLKRNCNLTEYLRKLCCEYKCSFIFLFLKHIAFAWSQMTNEWNSFYESLIQLTNKIHRQRAIWRKKNKFSNKFSFKNKCKRNVFNISFIIHHLISWFQFYSLHFAFHSRSDVSLLTVLVDSFRKHEIVWHEKKNRDKKNS